MWEKRAELIAVTTRKRAPRHLDTWELLPRTSGERRFEHATLKRVLPVFGLYLLLLAIWPPLISFRQWQAMVGFTRQITETSLQVLPPRIESLAAFTEANHPAEIPDQDAAVNELLKRYEICKGLFHGFNWSKFFTGTATEKINILPLAQEHILGLDDGKKRLLQAVRELSLAFALAVPDERALAIRDDVAFFQAVRAALVKSTVEGERSAEDIDQAIRQILSRAVAASDQVIDIFAAAGLKKPEISILSEEFLAEVRGMPQKNLAIELLRKLLNDELKLRMKKNLVQTRSFTELLERTIRSYQNRTLESAEVIAELIKLAEEMREAQKRGEKLGLAEDEIAFYDALEVNDSAVKVLGDDTLKNIARELVETVRNNTTIDWTVRETVRAKLRVMVKRILRKYGYPPDKQEKATQTVLEQAEVIARDWAG